VAGYDLDGLPDDIAGVRPSVVIVDAGPHLEVGRVVVRHVRALPTLADIPILLCIQVSRLSGLDVELGIDDFILSPVSGPEIYARVQQLIKRLSSITSAGRITLHELVINTLSVEATFRGRVLTLPRQEFQLLKFLAEGPGRVYTRAQLLSRVWGYRYTGNTRTVDIHVRRLRFKLGTGAEMIETVRHVGYRMKSATPTS
jgi:DNA-binding response OmpR family regulator